MLARVVLKKAKTYSLGGKRYIKDVPVRIEGEDQIRSFQENAYFSVTVLEGKVGKRKGKTPKEIFTGKKFHCLPQQPQFRPNFISTRLKV